MTVLERKAKLASAILNDIDEDRFVDVEMNDIGIITSFIPATEVVLCAKLGGNKVFGCIYSVSKKLKI